MSFRNALTLLLAAALVLPIAELMMLGLGRLLAAMGDLAGAMVLDRISLAGGLLWVLDLVCLLLVLAAQSLPPRDPPS
jgi:hypothetical protein